MAGKWEGFTEDDMKFYLSAGKYTTILITHKSIILLKLLTANFGLYDTH